MQIAQLAEVAGCNPPRLQVGQVAAPTPNVYKLRFAVPCHPFAALSLWMRASTLDAANAAVHARYFRLHALSICTAPGGGCARGLRAEAFYASPHFLLDIAAK